MYKPTLEQNPFAQFDDKGDPSVPTLTLQVYKYIDATYQDFSNHVARCSAASLCVKRRQFQRQGAPAEPMAPRVRINFMNGDHGEAVMLYFIKQACVGLGKLYSEIDFGKVVGTYKLQGKEVEIYAQKDLSFKTPNGLKITGHCDGMGRRNSDGQWEFIECKTASDWGFHAFKEQGPTDYAKQATALLCTDEAKERGIKQVRFVFQRKQTGHLWDALFDYDSNLANEVLTEFEQAESDQHIEPPHSLEPEYQGRGKSKRKTGRLTAKNFPCSYCPYLRQCHGNHHKEFKRDRFGNNKPIYIFDKKGSSYET